MALDIFNPNVANALPGNGELNFYAYHRLYGRATLGYQWSPGDGQFLVEPRFSVGYTNYAVNADGTFQGFLAANSTAYLAKDEIQLSGSWPSVALGTKLRYRFNSGASETFLLMEIHRIAGSIETSVER